jgi:hypothetical protein
MRELCHLTSCDYVGLAGWRTCSPALIYSGAIRMAVKDSDNLQKQYLRRGAKLSLILEAA